MKPDADSIDDIFNEVQADVDEWLEKAMASFQSGPINRVADMIWNKQPEEIKKATEAQMPEVAANLNKLRTKRG